MADHENPAASLENLPLFTEPETEPELGDSGEQPGHTDLRRSVQARLASAATPDTSRTDSSFTTGNGAGAHKAPDPSQSNVQNLHDRLRDGDDPTNPMTRNVGRGENIDWSLVRAYREQAADQLAHALRTREGLDEAGRRELGRSIVVELLADHAERALTKGLPIITQDEQIQLAEAIMAALFGLGRLQPLVDDPDIENIEINGADNVHLIYSDGRIEQGPPVADSDEELIETLSFLASRTTSNERPFSPTNPRLHLRLPDSSRLAATAWITPRPVAVIRKHRLTDIALDDLVDLDMLTPAAASFLGAAVRARKSIVVSGSQGAGKALALDTPIPTPDGWTTMGRLRAGDRVFDETGQARGVRYAHEVRDDRPCYEVVFDTGETMTTDRDHLWRVLCPDDEPDLLVTITELEAEVGSEHAGLLHEVLEHVGPYERRRAPSSGGNDAVDDVPLYSRHLVRKELAERIGTSAGATVTDLAVLTTASLAERLQALGAGTSAARPPVIRTAGALDYMRQPQVVDPYVFGLRLGRDPLAETGIPTPYLRGDTDQRSTLLRGLMDARQSRNDTGDAATWTGDPYEFTTTSKDLAADVHELVAGLGNRAALTSTSDQSGAYSVTWNNEACGHTVVDVRPVPSVPVRCITVDSPSSLYLAGRGCIPTHNTTLVRALTNELDPMERIGTIETEYELHLHNMPERHHRIVAWESRPGSGERGPDGRAVGEITLDDLVFDSLRMNLSRLIVGEVRGREVLPMFKAMQSGAGSLSTTHAHSARAAIERLVTCAMEAGQHVTETFSYRQIAEHIDIVVQIELRDESRAGGKRTRYISEIIAVEPGEHGMPAVTDAFRPGSNGFAVPGTSPIWLPDLERVGFDPRILDREG